MTGAQSRFSAFAALGAGVIVIAFASILIRTAQEAGMSSLAIAAGRLGIAALVLAPFALGAARREWVRLTAAERWIVIGSGSALALHFATWISSLEHTSVASSTALVTTNPLWVGLAAAFLLRERVGALGWVGIALTFLGTIVIVAADGDRVVREGAGSALLGNALALIGAITASAYLLAGRHLRTKVTLLAYVWMVYAIAAVLLIAMAAMQAAGDVRSLVSLPAIAWLAVLALALGPQLIGHTAVNLALRRLSAPFTAVAILGEPIGSALLAWLMLAEPIGAMQLAGFALIGAGIVAAARGERAG